MTLVLIFVMSISFVEASPSSETLQNASVTDMCCGVNCSANCATDQATSSNSTISSTTYSKQCIWGRECVIDYYNCSTYVEHLCNERNIENDMQPEDNRVRYSVECLDDQFSRIRAAIHGLVICERCINGNDSLEEYNCSIDALTYIEGKCKEGSNNTCKTEMLQRFLDELPVRNGTRYLLQSLTIIYECQNKTSSTESVTRVTEAHRTEASKRDGHTTSRSGKNAIGLYEVPNAVAAKGNMTVTPRNKVTMVGERVELGCSVERNSSVYKWEVTRHSWVMTNKSTVREIETIARLDKNFGWALVNITHLGLDVDSTGSGVIYYNSTDLDYAGNYTCRAHVGPYKDTIFYSAQLIVLESLPNCSSNYTNDNDNESSKDVEAITMQCNLNFRGFWAPTMQWTRHNGDGRANGTNLEVGGVIKIQTIPNSNVASSLTVGRDSLVEGTFFSCKIYFEGIFDGFLIMNATNVPDFVYLWNSSVYSKAPSSSHTMEQTNSSSQVLPVPWWVSICVAVPLMVVIAASAFCIRNRMRARQDRLQKEQVVYENVGQPEYDEINESQINPVDNPPKTRPRLQTNTMADYSTTCIEQPEDEMAKSTESMSHDEPVHDCLTAALSLSLVSDDLKTAETSPTYHILEPIENALAPIIENQEME